MPRWLSRQCEYNGGLVLPKGFRLPEPFDFLRDGAKYDAWTIAGAKACCKQNNLRPLANGDMVRASQQLTFIVDVDGLKVMNELWTTDKDPGYVAESFYKSGETNYRESGPNITLSETNEGKSGPIITNSGPETLPACDPEGPVEAATGLHLADVAGCEPVQVAADVNDGMDSVASDSCDQQRVPDNLAPLNQPGTKNQEPLKPSFCGIVAVIDYMSLLVRAYFAGPPSKIHAVRSMFETIGNLIERLSPEYLVFAYDSPGPGERSKIYPGYKSTREAKPPELLNQIQLGQQAIEAIGWPSIRVRGWEADDILASVARQIDTYAAGVYLVTSDKDALQISATTQACVYHPWGDGLHVTRKVCLEKHGVSFEQINGLLALKGDKTDDIPGVEGIGDKIGAELMQTHGSLEAILAAAAAGKIKGKLGQRLVTHADAARMSQQLVTLQDQLPIGIGWQKWPCRTPRVGWRSKLESLGLGMVAAGMLKRLIGLGVNEVIDHGSANPHHEVEWITMDLEPVQNFLQPIKTMPRVENPPMPVEESGGLVSSPPIESMPLHEEPGTRNAEQTPLISTEMDWSTWYPNLMACPADAPLIDKVRAVWRVGRNHFERGHAAVNDWRRDHVYHAAYDDGLQGRPLSIDLGDCDDDGKLLEQKRRLNTKDTKSTKEEVKAGSLF